MKYRVIYLIVVNILGMWLFAFDKYQAKRQKPRIRENTLLKLGLVGGAFGEVVGMFLFRHKTKQKRFRILLPIFCLVWIFIFIIVECGGMF